MPFSDCRTTSIPGSRKAGVMSGMPIPRLTTMPSVNSLAARLMMRSRLVVLDVPTLSSQFVLFYFEKEKEKERERKEAETKLKERGGELTSILNILLLLLKSQFLNLLLLRTPNDFRHIHTLQMYILWGNLSNLDDLICFH